MHVQQRETRDPNGRVVDIYQLDITISVMVLRATPSTDDSILLVKVLETLRAIQQSQIKKIRNRDLSVFTCHWNVHGQELVGIGLPARLDLRLHQLFQERLSSVAEIIEIGNSLAKDVGAEPFARYLYGKIIAYVDPLDTDVCDAARKPGIELRSAESAAIMTSNGTTSSRLPLIRSRASRRHSITTWEEMRNDILKFIWEILEPGTFNSLRREIGRQFGISVQLASTSLAGKHGSITTGWMINSDQSCEVSILINEDLSEKLKYVVLAHELAHYVTHFPLILAGQLIDQLAWMNPSIEIAYMDLFSAAFQDGRVLEEQANLLASQMLIPPRCNIPKLAEIMYENYNNVSKEELAWRFLQQFFPETDTVQYSWHNWDEMRIRAERDIEWARGVNAMNAETLYHAMLQSTLKRKSRESHELSIRASTAVYDFWAAIPVILQNAAKQTQDFTHPILTLPGIDAIGTSRKILEPIIYRHSSISRHPIVPATKPGTQQLWKSVLDLSARPRTVEEWRRLHPTDSFMLYPDRPVPIAPVYCPSIGEGPDE